MTETFIDGDNVLISGFETFKFKDKQPCKGVSPKTKEYIIIPGSKTISFKPSHKLKKEVDN